MAKLTDMMGRPSTGVVPFAVVGIVTENVDPDELGRIRVKFPTLHEEPLSFWIRQSSPNGGKERGLYALPEIEDEVLVVFLHGAQDMGIIIGQFWNGSDIPPKECKDGMPKPGDTDFGAQWATSKFTAGTTSLDANDRRFWKSRSGSLLVFDDSSGAESVHLWNNTHTLSLVFDTAENLITLGNTAGNIEIRAAKDLVLEAGENIRWIAGQKIEGESGTSTAHKAGTNYDTESGTSTTLKSGTSFDIEAGTSLTCKASIDATVKGSVNFTGEGGATATLKGGASTTVKGGVVLIN